MQAPVREQKEEAWWGWERPCVGPSQLLHTHRSGSRMDPARTWTQHTHTLLTHGSCTRMWTLHMDSPCSHTNPAHVWTLHTWASCSLMLSWPCLLEHAATSRTPEPPAMPWELPGLLRGAGPLVRCRQRKREAQGKGWTLDLAHLDLNLSSDPV